MTRQAPSIDIERRCGVRIVGGGDTTLLLANGFGCDQNMWRRLVPLLSPRFRIVLFDYVGSGQSDHSQYDANAYSGLEGYAKDLVAVATAVREGPLVLVAHSVSAMIGLLAEKQHPGVFDAHVMIGPSPSYLNDGAYHGGFERADIDDLLVALESNYLGWAVGMAPVIMGAPGQPELSDELSNSFCRTDPAIAARFARATFLGNNLADLPSLEVPVLVLQSTEDIIAPVGVGEHVSRTVANGTLRLIDNIGHCPHLSAPEACAAEIEDFLAGQHAGATRSVA